MNMRKRRRAAAARYRRRMRMRQRLRLLSEWSTGTFDAFERAFCNCLMGGVGMVKYSAPQDPARWPEVLVIHPEPWSQDCRECGAVFNALRGPENCTRPDCKHRDIGDTPLMRGELRHLLT